MGRFKEKVQAKTTGNAPAAPNRQQAHQRSQAAPRQGFKARAEKLAARSAQPIANRGAQAMQRGAMQVGQKVMEKRQDNPSREYLKQQRLQRIQRRQSMQRGR